MTELLRESTVAHHGMAPCNWVCIHEDQMMIRHSLVGLALVLCLGASEAQAAGGSVSVTLTNPVVTGVFKIKAVVGYSPGPGETCTGLEIELFEYDPAQMKFVAVPNSKVQAPSVMGLGGQFVHYYDYQIGSGKTYQVKATLTTNPGGPYTGTGQITPQ